MHYKFQGKLVGEFTKIQEVVASSFEEARKMFEGNLGEDIEESATGTLEITNIENVETGEVEIISN